MKTQQSNFYTMEKEWPKIKNIVSVPHTQKQYNEMVAFLDMLIDQLGNDQNHPLASLMETLGTLIETYENQVFSTSKKDSKSILKYLMKEHGLKQKDMNEIGSQGVVSEILSGKRNLNMRQIQTLALKFNVSPTVFI